MGLHKRIADAERRLAECKPARCLNYKLTEKERLCDTVLRAQAPRNIDGRVSIRASVEREREKKRKKKKKKKDIPPA